VVITSADGRGKMANALRRFAGLPQGTEQDNQQADRTSFNAAAS
jgi:hypothetical protein